VPSIKAQWFRYKTQLDVHGIEGRGWKTAAGMAIAER
jgi:hypothetical protein